MRSLLAALLALSVAAPVSAQVGSWPPLVRVAAAPAAYVIANYTDASCEQPPTAWGGTGSGGGGTTYYVDPGVAGNNANSGLATHPVKDLSTGLGKLATANDTLVLEGGNYGAAFAITNSVKTGWTRVMADTGQVPVFTSFDMSGSQRWLVQGVKVQHWANAAQNFDTIGVINVGSGAAKNIVLDSGEFNSVDNGASSGWTTRQDWQKATFYGLLVQTAVEGDGKVTCVGLNRMSFYNLRTNVALTGDKLLIQDSTIKDFSGDAIDFEGDKIAILRNTITDNHRADYDGTPGTGFHQDGIQGQFGLCTITYCAHNTILIDGNYIAEKTSATEVSPAEGTEEGLQGVSMYDNDWTGVTVTNNRVITDALNIIALESVHDADVANNTGLGTGKNGGNEAISVTLLGNESTSPSNNVHIWNNIASNIGVDNIATATTDHNYIPATGFFNWWGPSGGSVSFNHTPGTYGTANIITATGLSSFFNSFNTTTYAFDLTLKIGSLAIGAGTTPAPNHSDGSARSGSVDEGAY